MKLIIAGCRDFCDRSYIERHVHENFDITEVSEIVSGRARGVDTIGEEIAEDHDIPVEPFPPEYDKYRGGAPLVRNTQMADYADALLAFPSPRSRGTRDMIRKAHEQGLVVVVVEVPG